MSFFLVHICSLMILCFLAVLYYFSFCIRLHLMQKRQVVGIAAQGLATTTSVCSKKSQKVTQIFLKSKNIRMLQIDRNLKKKYIHELDQSSLLIFWLGTILITRGRFFYRIIIITQPQFSFTIFPTCNFTQDKMNFFFQIT